MEKEVEGEGEGEKISFNIIDMYERISTLLRDSLSRIVMNKGVEFIISSSTQVKIGKEIMRAKGKYSEWKLIKMIYKSIYIGFHICKQDGYLVIHSLSFEIDDPIPFSMDTTWTAHVYGMSKYQSAIFSGSSAAKLFEITTLLFKRDIKIQVFKNSSLLLSSINKSDRGDSDSDENNVDSTDTLDHHHYYYCHLSDKEGDLLSILLKDKLEHFFYMETNEKNEKTFYFTRKFDDTISQEKRVGEATFRLEKNEKRDIFTLNYAIKSIEEALKTLDQIKITNSLPDGNNNSNSNSNNNGNSNGLGFGEHTSQTFQLENVSTTDFLDIFRNAIGRLIFESSVFIPMIVTFQREKSVQNLKIKFGKGVFSIAITDYLIDYFSGKKMKYIITGSKDSILHIKSNFIAKVEVQQGHYLQLVSQESSYNNYASLFRSMNRILLIWNNDTSPIDTIKRSNTIKMSSKITTTCLNVIINMMKKCLANGVHGAEIILDREKDLVTVNSLQVIKSKMLIMAINNFITGSNIEWRFVIVDLRTGSLIGSNICNSYEFPLYFWRSISADLFISSRRVLVPELDKSDQLSSSLESLESESESIRGKILEIEGVEERFHVKLLEILLSHKPSFEIYEFRLKYGFSVEIHLVEPELIDKFIEFLKLSLGSSRMTFKILKESKLKSKNLKSIISALKIYDSDPIKKFPRKLNVHGNLIREEAFGMLSEKSRATSAIQVIERERDCVFSGHLIIIYYNEKNVNVETDIIDHIGGSQVMRMGKLENYKRTGLSFFFIQYSTNLCRKYEPNCSSYKRLVVCSFDLNKPERIDSIFNIAMNAAEEFNLKIQKLL